MENEKNIPQELLGLFPQMQKQIDDFRHKMLLESLKLLGFTFKSVKEEKKFIKKNLLSVSALDSPGILRLYLNYGQPKQVLLAEYNDNPEINEKGQMFFKDVYYTAEEDSDRVYDKKLKVQ